MFRLIPKLIAAVAANTLGLYLAGRFITGVIIPTDLKQLLIAAGVLTAINVLAKPILKLVLSPIIIITLGLGLIVVNAITLYILDYLMVSVTIPVLLPLVYATLLVSVINYIVRKI
ncbi:MAG: hypothetical protein A3B23_00220 [Candidatus Colwellbacteria bacterium RIFCSPLOWO2_01_FULL_48_10]|uniref:Phage holin family protein n=1 Tax=Candidatus Colwellbacteria bacterium RIFCSPLOWO2_01_FULL_48_10 TaxID=1797690 RepID=A0A1G1Z6R5_9BACT|nr:MAG: hypothetical protein A3B23_00220 [Candidatus Colwellbacteria bacterium RIFCSPLOWO2_01_FULL_48_10]